MSNNVMSLAGGAMLLALSCFTWAQPSPSKAPADAQVYFITPHDGQTVAETFTVQFGLKGMGVAPAGVVIDGTGHHHLLIDASEAPALDSPLPATEHIRHFGAGQTQTELTLAPGKHTLQLIMGDHGHVPHQPPVQSEVIHITVE